MPCHSGYGSRASNGVIPGRGALAFIRYATLRDWFPVYPSSTVELLPSARCTLNRYCMVYVLRRLWSAPQVSPGANDTGSCEVLMKFWNVTVDGACKSIGGFARPPAARFKSKIEFFVSCE